MEKRYLFLAAFLLYGLMIGAFSYWRGKNDFVFLVNPLGSEISERIYNGYLLPNWKNTLEPVGYEYHNIIDLETEKIIGQEKVPLYDFPVKDVSELYLPVSVLSWGLTGLVVEVVLNVWKRLKITRLSSTQRR